MFQEILTERLLLRSLLTDDAENMFAYRSHPEIIRYQFWQPQSLEEVHSFIGNMTIREFNNSGWYQIGITPRSDSNLIGDVGIHVLDTDARIVEIGITIAPDHQSKGYATEALKAIFELLFAKLDKHRVTASVDPRNLASMALMKRNGLRQEGHFRESIWFNEIWADDVIFAMLASEWRSLNP